MTVGIDLEAIEDIYPLSPVQQGMLFHTLYAPGSGVYFEQTRGSLIGVLDRAAFERAWTRAIARHPILRTALAWEDLDEPMQVVFREVSLPLEHHDWRDRSPGDRRDQLEAWLRADRERGFDLSQAPLMRLALFRMDEASYAFVWSRHHILLDGWSVALLLKEVFADYEASCWGEDLCLEAPRPYRDYIAWLQQQDLAEAESFWRKTLRGFNAPIHLVVDEAPGRALGAEAAYATQELRLSAEATERLHTLTRQHQLTLNTLMQGAWGLLLSRYSGETDIVFGAVMAGRPPALDGVESMLGLFVNTLPVRVRVTLTLELLPWLRDIQTQQAEMLQYEHSPLVQVQGWSDVPRGQSLFDSLLVVETYPIDASLRAQSGSLEVRDLIFIEPTNYPLTAFAAPGAELLLRIDYDTAHFAAETIERLLAHWRNLLESMAADPDRPLLDLSPLSEAERRRMLFEWNATQADYPHECLPRLFEAQVDRTPDVVAAVFDEAHLTYRELNRCANQLAHHLAASGVAPGDLVGVCLDRSLEMAISVLGVLKAGGAYLPLDPSYPAERLAYMLSDSGACVVLTQQSLVATLPAHIAQIICLDTDWSSILQPHSAPLWGPWSPTPNPASLRSGGRGLQSPISADNLLYVIYTSGSTGRPKGVALPHRTLANLIAWQCENWTPPNAARTLQFAPLSFDVSCQELFAAWLTGGTLVLIDDTLRRDPERLLRRMDESAIERLFLPFVALQHLAEAANARGLRPSHLRDVITAGEQLQVTPEIAAWFGALKTCVLHNQYGPTESHVVTAYRLGGAPSAWSAHAPIGRPVANAAIHLLDAQMQPVPVGVPGELYIGGVGLADGYLNRPDLTAERFIPNPFLKDEGGGMKDEGNGFAPSFILHPSSFRLYKTGDLARYRADGTIEFLGRADYQVKVRGYRIEPGEIEAALGQHPAVRAGVVVARDDVSMDRTLQLVAYLVAAEPGRPPSSGDLRRFLQSTLPDYMLPSAFVVLEALPLTPSGKVDRRALPAPDGGRARSEAAYTAPRTQVEQTIAGVWREVLGLEQVGMQDNFFDLGGHSLLLIRVQSKLREALNRDVAMIDLFRYPTIGALAHQLTEPAAQSNLRRPAETTRPEHRSTDIAIIGMAGQFPGAENLDRFWENLRDGVESISFFSDEEMLAAGVEPSLVAHPDYVNARGILDGIDGFDAAFFSYSPREAELMDPQHRFFLECAWAALEDAGYAAERCDKPVGVYAGLAMNGYLLFNLYSNRERLQGFDPSQMFIGNSGDFLATRVSYKLNLKGPSFTVQTACSTSLVAVCLACESLSNGKCDMALAGGASINDPRRSGYLYQTGGIHSPDGHCRAFDADAQGTVSGSGVGVVVLKRLSDALADGDPIRAVIRGFAVNNDGAVKVGYTAPSVEGQAQVIAQAQAMAGIDPETITYVETHGTATPLGDPIEIAALTLAFRAMTQKSAFCAVGSVKTNIGHADAAAGVAGLIKTVLALQHAQIPPSLHFKRPNPQIDFERSPFYVNTMLSDWLAAPRRAGVSSFGMGGTNAHVVVEEAPAIEPSSESRPWQVLLLSAKTPDALDAATVNLANYLAQHTDSNLADVAYTLQVGRNTFAQRRAVICRDRDEAVNALNGRLPDRVFTQLHTPIDSPAVFMFPGQGTQHAEMGLELYRGEPVFREEVDRCAELLRPHFGLDLREVLYPDANQAQASIDRLNQTALTQPALFTIEYALAKLWMAWGVQPAAMIGHSIGEYVAACLADVFSLEQALALVVERGRLMQQLPAGAMLSVPLPESELRPLLKRGLSLAAINGPSLCVVAGTPEAIEAARRQLAERGVECSRLHTTRAFHSDMAEPLLEPFRRYVAVAKLNPPRIPFVSNVSGAWITDEQAISPAYWAQHLRQPVRFADGLDTLLQEPNRVLLEVGPGHTLSALAKRQIAARPGFVALNSMRHPRETQSDLACLLTALGRLWLAGVHVNWPGFYVGERRRRSPLPTYPFERRRYWIDPMPAGAPIVALDAPMVDSEIPVDAVTTSSRYSRPNLQTAFVAPRDERERALAGIWQDVLGIEAVGVHDNFFDLGGHSLLTIQVVSRLREMFGVEFSMQQLFTTPTVATLAESLAEQPAAVAIPPLQPILRDGDLPLSFAQEQLWLLDQVEPGLAAYNIFAAVSLAGPLDVAALARSLDEIVRRHEVLRTTFGSVAGRPRLRIAPSLHLDAPLIDARALSPGEREVCLREAARRAAQLPFDLARGPLLRFWLVQLADEEHAVLLALHHIVADGWSMDVLIREMATLYAAFRRGEGRGSPLPDLPIQYVDYAAWQRRRLQMGGVLDRQLAYWRRQLGGELPLLRLPEARPRPPVQTFAGGRQAMPVDADVYAALKRLSRESNATLFMTLLAAFAVLLHRRSGQADIVIGTDIANRDWPETEKLIGFFVNQLVLRIRFEGNPRFRDLLESVRETVLGAYAHQDVPFEKLVEALRPRRSLSHTPLFQVKVMYQPTVDFEGELPGLQLKPVEASGGLTKYDLTLFVWDTGKTLSAILEYRVDLFDAGSVASLASRYATLLRRIAARPEARLNELDVLTDKERRQIEMEQHAREKAGFKQFKAIKPKAVSLPQGELVTTGYLQPGQRLPLVVQPGLEGLDLAEWAGANAAYLEGELLKHGAVLFRGFGVSEPPVLERFASALCANLFEDNGEHPHISLSGKVYTPVFYPAHKKLLWHSENSFNYQWPLRIWFACARPAAQGGETPVVDNRRLYEALPAELQERFERKGVMYLRNYGEGLGRNWQEVFRTNSRAEVEAACRVSGMEFEWLPNDRLRTRCVRPAAIRHPRTGEVCWFNQAQHWHVSCLDPDTGESLKSMFAEEDLPRNCYYGDGSPIADETMAAILDLYARLETSFPWQLGDVMLVDNVLAAHGRNAFSGERKILVALGEMTNYE